MSDAEAKQNSDLQITFPAQRILFGSPGTGKSHRVHEEYLKDFPTENVIKTVFHPEYKYGDFMGRLMPHTKSGQVSYEYQAGHFMKALAGAYQCLLEKKENEEVQQVALVIDELNRGNSSAIFGTVFQLLDRDENGWSSYKLDLSDIEKDCLLKRMRFSPSFDQHGTVTGYTNFSGIKVNDDETLLLNNNKIRIPPNLSILATMNTSDESIYYMDSAFKRRWDWEFVPVDGDFKPAKDNAFGGEEDWKKFAAQLNAFIKCNSKHIRKVEDKLIGYHFIKAPYTHDKIQSKLMFFLWDSVFSHDKTPLKTLLEEKEIITFGDFANQVETFVTKINAFTCPDSDKKSK